MEKTYIIKIAICIVYYHMGGLATTNIERLCKGCNIPVAKSECFCPVCGKKIKWFLQLPIISYIICGGKCRSCSSEIPKKSLILEILIFAMMVTVSAVFDFLPIGVLLSFGCYELIKIIWVILNGKREKDFAKEYFISIILNACFLTMTEFMALLLVTVT